ncbi:MAG: transposase [Cyanobacteria bacterium P01_A01_bin.135]
MPNYRRLYIPGSTVFLTWVTHQRAPLFRHADNVAHLRQAVSKIKAEDPFDTVAAVVLPDHIHFVWTLPDGDRNYSKRVGRIKVLFTQSFRGRNAQPSDVNKSRRKHRESNVWQRRFWERTVRTEEGLARCLDYIHYNPVKHGRVSCPHQWPYSSFQKWVDSGHYQSDWACRCPR